MFNVTKPQCANQNLRNISISNQQLSQILTFCDKKKKTKKVITLFELHNRLKQSIINKMPTTVAYTNSYILRFLITLQMTGYINTFFRVPSLLLKSFFRYGYKPFIHNNLVLVFLQPNTPIVRTSLHITFISRPGREIHVSYKKLVQLNKTQQNSAVFIVNTTQGLIVHKLALQKQIGGNLVCLIN